MSEILKNPNRINFSIINFNVNYRNTSAISNLLSKLIKKYFPKEKLIYSEHSDTNKGRLPTLIEANSFEEIVTKTIEQVKNLISKEKFKPMEIGVLGVDSMRPSNYGTRVSMGNELKKLDLKVIDAWNYSLPYLDTKETKAKDEENDITFSDVRSFKGLEKEVIILVNFSEIDEKTVQQIYTGLSRARGDLIVISNQKSINQIKELL
jgi:superfamily I DNA and RNA helicase